MYAVQSNESKHCYGPYAAKDDALAVAMATDGEVMQLQFKPNPNSKRLWGLLYHSRDIMPVQVFQNEAGALVKVHTVVGDEDTTKLARSCAMQECSIVGPFYFYSK